MKTRWLFILVLFMPALAFCLPSINDIKQHGIIDVSTVQKVWKKAQAGDVISQSDLGEAYLNGSIGTLPNYEQALYWLEKAAKQGEPVAYCNLAGMYWRGNGVKEDLSTARKYAQLAYDGLQKALKSSKEDTTYWRPVMQYNLGLLYFWGVEGIVDQDLNKAFQLFDESANAGFVHSIKMVAMMYRYGVGVTYDPKQAFQWAELLAQVGIASSQYNVGEAYLNGTGVKKDMNKGIKWLHESAKYGYYPAMVELIELERRGIISDISATQRQSWYKILNKISQQNPWVLK